MNTATRGTVKMVQDGDSIRVDVKGVVTVYAPETIALSPGASPNYWKGQGYRVVITKRDGTSFEYGARM